MFRINQDVKQKQLKIDKKDKKILVLLSEDSRMPVSEIAKKVQLSKDTVSYRIKRMVKEVIDGKLADGQLDECPLTLKDIAAIGDAFSRVLTAFYHGRIEYPEETPRSEENAKSNGSNDTKSSAKTEA